MQVKNKIDVLNFSLMKNNEIDSIFYIESEYIWDKFQFYVKMSKKLRKVKGRLLYIPTFRVDLTIHSVFISSDFLLVVP